MHKLAPAPLLVALALIPAAPAAAAPPWSEPVTISAGVPQVGEPSIDFAGNGRAVLSARLSTQAQGYPSRGFTRLWGQQPDGSFAGRARLVLAAPPVAYAGSRLALLRLPLAAGDRDVGDLDHPESSLGYSFGRCCGTLEVDPGGYRRLTARADRGSAAIAADDRGDVAAAWVEHLSGRDHLVVAVRRPGAPFGRPSVIAGSGFISSPSLAWSARGDLVVAYQRSISAPGPTRRQVEARVRRAGHNWGSAQRLGASSGFSEITAAAAADGRMLVAWGTQDGGEEAGTPWIVRAAMRPAGSSSRFRAAQELEASEGRDERPAGPVVAAIAPDGTATVAWSSIANAQRPHTFPVRAATAGSSLRFGAAQTLAANAAVGDVAIDAHGAAIVVWATLSIPGVNQITSQVFASMRAAGTAAFAAPEAVGPAERAELPRVAVDPVSGRPAVVWVSRVDGVAQRLRFAARTG